VGDLLLGDLLADRGRADQGKRDDRAEEKMSAHNFVPCTPGDYECRKCGAWTTGHLSTAKAIEENPGECPETSEYVSYPTRWGWWK
jgi:hypothetical protein